MNPIYGKKMAVLKKGDKEKTLERRGDDPTFSMAPKELHNPMNENMSWRLGGFPARSAILHFRACYAKIRKKPPARNRPQNANRLHQRAAAVRVGWSGNIQHISRSVDCCSLKNYASIVWRAKFCAALLRACTTFPRAARPGRRVGSPSLGPLAARRQRLRSAEFPRRSADAAVRRHRRTWRAASRCCATKRASMSIRSRFGIRRAPCICIG